MLHAGLRERHPFVRELLAKPELSRRQHLEVVDDQEDEFRAEVEQRVLDEQLVQDLRLRLRQLEQTYPARLRCWPPRLEEERALGEPLGQLVDYHEALLHPQSRIIAHGLELRGDSLS